MRHSKQSNGSDNVIFLKLSEKRVLIIIHYILYIIYKYSFAYTQCLIKFFKAIEFLIFNECVKQYKLNLQLSNWNNFWGQFAIIYWYSVMISLLFHMKPCLSNAYLENSQMSKLTINLRKAIQSWNKTRNPLNLSFPHSLKTLCCCFTNKDYY